jgi:hypothetical protein
MAFTVAELANIANGALDFHYKGQPFAQTIQDKPLLALLESGRKTFPGGKGDITVPVRGKYEFEDTDNPNPRPGTLTGYTHNDTVKYGTITGLERAKYTWRELHTGFTLTWTELKMDGISVVDSVTGDGENKHSKREVTAITNLMQDKIETYNEVLERQMNAMLWGDGSADAKGLVGIQHFITATPNLGTTGGISRVDNAWWRNRYATVNTASAELIPAIHKELRQVRRYGGRPTRALAGADFIDQLVKELRAKGNYTDMGWASSGSTNIAIADVRYNNLKFEYDPTLDDLTFPKRCYFIDPTKLYLYAMEDEWGKDHAPARPYNQYVLYKARTYTGQLVCTQLNAHLLMAFT